MTTELPDGYHAVWDELSRSLFIPLTQGKFALIDADDAPVVCARKWNCSRLGKSKNWYAQGKHLNGTRTTLHRFLMDPPPGIQVDHKNRNTLDYRRSNLRLASALQNGVNREGWSATGYKGVQKKKGRTGFRAMIAGRFLGTFRTALEAAKAYDDAATRMWGDFAYLNLPSNAIAKAEGRIKP